MHSFQFDIDEKSAFASRFISHIRNELITALTNEKSERGLDEFEIATRLGVDKDAVKDMLSGKASLTLRSVAELAWAMDYADIGFTMAKTESPPKRN